MEAHHNEVEPRTVEAVIVQTADALSGARPGARGDSLEKYVERLQDLEEIASRHDGVERVYAMRAGREIRVIVDPGKIDDERAALISHEIAGAIEKEVEYPGQIKITVIRESRVDLVRELGAGGERLGCQPAWTRPCSTSLGSRSCCRRSAVSAIGLRFESFPPSRDRDRSGVIAYFAVLVGATTTFAVLNARDEQHKRNAEQAEAAATQPAPSGATTTADDDHGAAPTGKATTLKLAAEPDAIAYDTTQLSGKAGQVTIDFDNPSARDPRRLPRGAERRADRLQRRPSPRAPPRSRRT